MLTLPARPSCKIGNRLVIDIKACDTVSALSKSVFYFGSKWNQGQPYPSKYISETYKNTLQIY